MRPWIISSLIFLAVIAIALGVYHFETEQNWTIPPLGPDYKVIGIVDMDDDHHIDLSRLRNGDDVLLVVARNNLYYNKIMDLTKRLGNVVTENTRFELALVDENQDKIIDVEDPVWQYLYAVIFSNDGQTYEMKPLLQVGIRGILLKHLTPEGNHTVLLSDGSERTLYEFGQPLAHMWQNNVRNQQ